MTTCGRQIMSVILLLAYAIACWIWIYLPVHTILSFIWLFARGFYIKTQRTPYDNLDTVGHVFSEMVVETVIFTVTCQGLCQLLTGAPGNLLDAIDGQRTQSSIFARHALNILLALLPVSAAVLVWAGIKLTAPISGTALDFGDFVTPMASLVLSLQIILTALSITFVLVFWLWRFLRVCLMAWRIAKMQHRPPQSNFYAPSHEQYGTCPRTPFRESRSAHRNTTKYHARRRAHFYAPPRAHSNAQPRQEFVPHPGAQS